MFDSLEKIKEFVDAEVPNGGDGSFEPIYPGGLVIPVGIASPLANTNTATTALLLRGTRVIIPKTGRLRDLSIFVGTTSGNGWYAIYDTNDALAGNRTRLADSGSLALPGANSYFTWDPNLPVTRGQQLDLALMLDNATATLARSVFPTLQQAQLPANFHPAPGGALPKLSWTDALGSFAQPPATIPEATCTVAVNFPIIMARIS